MKASLAAIALIVCASTAAVAEDPKVPPARDPGGLPIALVGPGLDYMLPEIAQRLARDGEGEIIGYDFADDDRRPFKTRHFDETRGYGHPGTAAAKIILSEAPATRLIAVRATLEYRDNLGKAIDYAAATPAPIITILQPYASQADIELMTSAARHFKDRLFIAPAGDFNRDLDTMPAAIAGGAPNLLVVAAADAEGDPLGATSFGRRTVDVATDGGALGGDANGLADLSFSYQPGTGIAVARMTALAARLLAVEPDLKGESLKTRILSLARPEKKLESTPTRTGLIEKPWRPFRLE